MQYRTHRPAAPTLIRTLAAGLLLGGCDTSAPASATAPPAATAAISSARLPAARGQVEEAGAVATALGAAWGDADAYTAPFADDADFVSPLGVILQGRAAIHAQHAFLFAGPFRGSRRESHIRRVTFLTGTIAVVDLDVRVTGFVALPPGLRPTEPGVVRTRERLVVAKRGGEWRIVMNQITAVAPTP